MSSGMGNPSMGLYSHELFADYDVDLIISCANVQAKGL